jgi:hypothetical protein
MPAPGNASRVSDLDNQTLDQVNDDSKDPTQVQPDRHSIGSAIASPLPAEAIREA